MTPDNSVTIGKCACGHSRAAHSQARLGGCGFCGCLQFQLDDIVRETRSTPAPRMRPSQQPPKKEPS